MQKPVGNLTKLSSVPVGKIHKTSMMAEIHSIVDAKIASQKPQEAVREVIREVVVPTPESKPELTREDVIEAVKENYPSIDSISAQVLNKLPPMGGGNSWTVADMPGYRKARSGYVFGILNKVPGFYDPTVLGIVNGTGDEVPYTRLIDTDGSYMYIGEADPGTAEGAALWRIKRVEFIGDDIEIKWAAGTATFDKVWTNRASEAYS